MMLFIDITLSENLLIYYANKRVKNRILSNVFVTVINNHSQ